MKRLKNLKITEVSSVDKVTARIAASYSASATTLDRIRWSSSIEMVYTLSPCSCRGFCAARSPADPSLPLFCRQSDSQSICGARNGRNVSIVNERIPKRFRKLLSQLSIFPVIAQAGSKRQMSFRFYNVRIHGQQKRCSDATHYSENPLVVWLS